MMKKTFCLILVLVCFAMELVPAGNPETEKKVDELFRPLVEDDLISGSILIAKAGKILLAKGYGPANREWGIPNGPDTRFRLGSVSKQITAMGILILVRQNKLDLQDCLDKFIEGYPNGENITIHHLLTHTSGIQSYNRIKDYGEKLIREMSISEVIDWFKNEPAVGKAGEKFAYSNSGYVLLAAIIEKVSGKKYREFLRDEIFVPLGMASSGQDMYEEILPRRASGYTVYDGVLYQSPYRNMAFTSGAGSLYSTVQDLFKWTRALLNHRLIDEELTRRMFTPEKKIYGYGWFIRQHKDRKLIEHAGAINGFGTQVQIFPDQQVVVIGLYNYESTFQRQVDRALAAIALGEAVDPVYFPRGTGLSPGEFKKVHGTFKLSHDGSTFTLFEKEGALTARFSEDRTLPCVPQSKDTFFIKKLNFLFKVLPGKNGKNNQLLIQAGLHRLRAQRIQPPG
jgi:CubicO group peptidase (beta-lactamase class C family)